MIQIIAGTFGYFDGRKVKPITNASGPQRFDPELEARLVKKGIAVYVGDVPVDDQDDAEEEKPEYSADMKLEELKEIAAAYGVDAAAMRKKSDIIAAIEAAKQTDDTEDEMPPVLGVADPV